MPAGGGPLPPVLQDESTGNGNKMLLHGLTRCLKESEAGKACSFMSSGTLTMLHKTRGGYCEAEHHRDVGLRMSELHGDDGA